MTAAVKQQGEIRLETLESSKRKLIQQHIDFLKSFELRGGPELNEYNSLCQFFAEATDAIRSGAIGHEDLKIVWDSVGEAFNTTRTLQGHVICRPYGYAGDFEIIEKIYENWVSPDARLEKWDLFFHSQQAPIAVRNRKRYFLNLLRSNLSSSNSGSLKVLNVASGPARDVLEFLSEQSGSVRFDCVDQDPRAVAYAKKINAPFLGDVQFHVANIFKYEIKEQYDVVWSAGLFDYLSDKEFALLLTKLYGAVAPGGELVVGNFSPQNTTRGYMEYGHWFLNHRSESELCGLAQSIGVAAKDIVVGSEPQCVNLFLHVRKR